MASFSGVETCCLLLIVCAHLVFVLVETNSSCSKSCTDFSKLCPSFHDSSFYDDFLNKQKTEELGKLKGHHVPPVPDCNNPYYQIICPMSCNQCTSCDASGDVSSLNSAAQSNAINLVTLSTDLESEKTATAELERKLTKCSDYVDSQQTTPEVDAESYRLVFKHTSNQITTSELETLFRYGTVSGVAQKNMGRDQYRDPNFHFYWHDTTSARLDIFDMTGQKDATIYLKLPVRSHATFAAATWPGIFNNNCQFARDSSKNAHYKTINPSCTKSQFYDDSRKPRMMFSEDDYCSKAWFFVQGGTSKYVCDIERSLRASPALNNEFTVAYYNGFNDLVYNQIGMKMASRFEIRISGSFVASTTNGFEKVFRYPSFAGVDVMDYFESGVIDSSEDRSQMTASQVKVNDMYRSTDMVAKIQGAGLVLFVIYDQQGAVAEAMTFKGTGDLKSWFGFSNLVSNINWNIYGGFKYFNIDGDNKNGRRFYIHEIYNGCKRDPGYLLVACNRANGNPPCSSYESMGDNSGDPRNYICKIIHTASNERSNSGFYSVASAMEIFVK